MSVTPEEAEAIYDECSQMAATKGKEVGFDECLKPYYTEIYWTIDGERVHPKPNDEASLCAFGGTRQTGQPGRPLLRLRGPAYLSTQFDQARRASENRNRRVLWPAIDLAAAFEPEFGRPAFGGLIPPTGLHGPMPGLDELDERLLALLKEDARASFVDLARGLDTSEGTVRARLKRLVDTGVIRRFTVVTTGHAVKALVGVRVAPHVPTSSVSKRIRELEGVTDVWEVSGEADILCRVDVPTTEGLDDVVERVRTMEDVEGTDSRLILREM